MQIKIFWGNKLCQHQMLKNGGRNMKIILFGAGAMSEKIIDYISRTSEHVIVAVADNKWGKIGGGNSPERGIKGHI